MKNMNSSIYSLPYIRVQFFPCFFPETVCLYSCTGACSCSGLYEEYSSCVSYKDNDDKEGTCKGKIWWAG